MLSSLGALLSGLPLFVVFGLGGALLWLLPPLESRPVLESALVGGGALVPPRARVELVLVLESPCQAREARSVEPRGVDALRQSPPVSVVPGAAFCPVFGGAFTVRFVTFSVVMGDGTRADAPRSQQRQSQQKGVLRRADLLDQVLQLYFSSVPQSGRLASWSRSYRTSGGFAR